MNNVENRVEVELNVWQAKEERFSKLFAVDLSRNTALNREKLRYFDRIALKYKGTKDLDERLTLMVLKQERRKLEKRLFRFLPIRLARRLLILPIRNMLRKQSEEKKVEQNSQAVHSQLHRAGYKELLTKVQAQMKLGLPQFTVASSNYINEKERMDNQLQFRKDSNGQYALEGIKASVFNEAKPADPVSHYFSLKTDQQIDVAKMYNLLSGRAVENNGTWKKLDFTDKGADGAFKEKTFKADFGYNLRTELQKLPLKELLTQESTHQLLNSLRQGNKQEVKFLKDGKEQVYQLEANPQHRSLNIYDEKSKKVSLSEALGKNEHKIIKLPVKQQTENDLAQSKRTKMKITR